MAINNETYFEFDEELDQGFTTIPNFILNDNRLTFKAVGVYVQILQYRNSGKHKVYLKSLSNYRKDKKTAVSTALSELEEFGYISRYYLRNEKGQMNGIKYVVRMKPIVQNIENTTNEPKAENPISDNPHSENTPLINKIHKKENGFKKENKDVVDDDKQTKLLNLYKSFNLEKRVMPHTVKLLKENIHISIEVFEQIFIAAAEDSVIKKYAYIKDVIDKLNSKKITTIKQYEADYKKYKDSKKVNTKSKGSVQSDAKNNKFNNFTQTFEQYSQDELNEIIDKSQNAKFKDDKLECVEDVDKNNFDTGKIVYEEAISRNWNIGPYKKNIAIEYAKENSLEYPKNI